VTRAALLRLTLFAAALGVGATAAYAQQIPSLIRIVVPFSAGGSNDVIARAMTEPLGKRLAATVIVDNKAGAAGVVGTDFVAKSPRDGSVLLLTSSSFLTAAATQPHLPYDPIAAFAPVAMIGRGPMLVAVPSDTPFKSPADIVTAARARPNALNYGTAGVGSIAHLATELFDDAAGIRMTHVPYKGASNSALDLAAGRIDVMISNYSTIAPLVTAGKIRTIAVTSSKAQPAFPGLSPLASAAPGFDVDIWVGVFAPAGTPAALVERLNREINAIAASTDLQSVLEPDGTLPAAITPAAFAARLKDELTQWKKTAADHKIVAE
jgi:tripartite-type tricarboxylate transporter receptor subunit TctC